jgi:acyl carrier protein
VTLAGEKTHSRIIEKSKQLNPHLEIVNEYGATENTVAAAIARDVQPGPSVPIGKPVSNTDVFILDRYDHLVPIGIPGQLCIAGAGISRGYLNNPELTAGRFLSISYRTNRTYSSQKIYKTGDLARWLGDGNIEYIGRLDQQVKIRGYRIESEEIERRLLQHETVAEAAVRAWESGTADRYLCAYIVPAGKEKEIDSGELKRFLSAGLPGYMVPAYFIVLEEMPLSHSGKLDRKKLPEPERVRPELAVKFVSPGTEMERMVAGIWQEVLELEGVGIHDNFFDLGGTSLTIIRVNTNLRKRFQEDIPMLDMFRYPTIQALASYLEDKETGELISREEIDEKVDRLEQTFQLLTGDKNE